MMTLADDDFMAIFCKRKRKILSVIFENIENPILCKSRK